MLITYRGITLETVTISPRPYSLIDNIANCIDALLVQYLTLSDMMMNNCMSNFD